VQGIQCTLAIRLSLQTELHKPMRKVGAVSGDEADQTRQQRRTQAYEEACRPFVEYGDVITLHIAHVIAGSSARRGC
jgi:hypothetical protein